jgi:nucleoside-diphosphate-sugar epimerase
MDKKVLLTGVTGFLGSHTAIQLLNKGYQVIGTLRKLERAEDIRKTIGNHTKHTDQLSFVQADLLDEKIWENLTRGIDYVQHIASPFPQLLPTNENELIAPAKNGTLYILKSAARNGVKRVVVTSSSGAIIYGKRKGQESGTYTEEDWTDIHQKNDTTPYFRSKTIAEMAAWEFMRESGNGMELSTVCPGAILGPLLERDFSASANIVIKTMDGSSPAIPKIGFDIVDVRSVAELLILAMEKEAAAGQRFIGSSGFMSFQEVAELLRHAFPDRKIPKMTLPNAVVRIFALFEKSLQPILIDLGKERRVDHSKAIKLLGWKPIDNQEAVLSCAKSAIELGLVK